MTEGNAEHQEQELERLTGNDVGLTREEALALLTDDDLWILPPEHRYVFELEPEEVVQEWEQAYDFAYSLSQGFGESKAINAATRMLLWDLQDRAEEALRRARQRAEE